MGCEFDDLDRNILEFRPKIQFVEPDAEPSSPNPLSQPPEQLQLEEIESERERIKQIAKAVDALAIATQVRLDDRAKGMRIKLDTVVDQDVIQALRRKGVKDPTVITYEQYRQCRDNIRSKGIAIAEQATTTPELVAAAGESDSQLGSQLGGFGTQSAAEGGLRPELDPRATIIPPINIEEFQINMICILVNFIWKTFIKPVIDPIDIAGLLPDELCDPGIPIEIPGLFILGNQPSDLLTGAVADGAKEQIKEGVNF
jgi:hypothetical protein